ncbi:protein SSUH2 homolog [Ptychodera flava]|uniref:protein SSUH2 homolog n=1 Tax=Ptychodera flava TaxID=63121 RepID=UPI003969E13C
MSDMAYSAVPSAPPSYDPDWLQSAEDCTDELEASGIDFDISDLGAPPGYETLGFSDTSVPPPYVPPRQPDTAPQHQFTSVFINEDEAKEALLSYVTQHCCYGKSAARDMNINNILPSNALHYQLVTFAEHRTTKRAFKSYKGERIDGPSNGSPPAPWDIPCPPRNYFENEVRHLEVPHTQELKKCHRCKGSGRITCTKCHGVKKVKCDVCNGNGIDRRSKRRCSACDGKKRRRCEKCNMSGRIVCVICHSVGKVKWFVKLTVIFQNSIGEDIVEHTDFPKDLIKGAEGSIIFDETQDMVYPVTEYPDQELNNISTRLVRLHFDTSQRNNKRIHKQRHMIRAVPVSEVHWTWQTHGSRFWVYGQEKKVHIQGYPQKYCYGCVIL